VVFRHVVVVKVLVAGIARDAAVKSGPVDDAAGFDVRAIRGPIEIFRPARVGIQRLPVRPVSGISTFQGDVAEWLKAAAC